MQFRSYSLKVTIATITLSQELVRDFSHRLYRFFTPYFHHTKNACNSNLANVYLIYIKYININQSYLILL